MTLTEKIIEEFEEKFSRLEMGYEELKSFLRSSLHQVATEAIEAVRLEKRETNNYKSSHNAVMHSHIDTGYNQALSEIEQKAKKFLENNK